MVKADRLPVLLLGGGGHARVCFDLLQRQGYEVLGYVAPRPDSRWDRRTPYIGDDDTAMDRFPPERAAVVNGVGFLPGSSLRRELFCKWKEKGYSFVSLVHDSAIVSGGARVEEGAQIMAGAVVQDSAVIGAGAIINTRASIDHDCFVGEHAHVAPGAVVCGGVTIERGVFIGAGAVVVQGIRIGAGSVIGAGSLVLRDVPPGSKVFGIPARGR